MDSIWLAIPIGMIFGFALSRGGLARYSNIAGVLRFSNMTLIKFVLTLLTVVMIALYALKGLDTVPFQNISATSMVGNLIGGLVFGMGMAVAGFCPVTRTVGAGVRRLDYFISGALGLLAGVLAYGMTYLQLFPTISRIAYEGPKTLTDLLMVNPFLIIGAVAASMILLAYFVERGQVSKVKLQKPAANEFNNSRPIHVEVHGAI